MALRVDGRGHGEGRLVGNATRRLREVVVQGESSAAVPSDTITDRGDADASVFGGRLRCCVENPDLFFSGNISAKQ